MKTIVTGGSGFIGSHLVKALLEKGREVVNASIQPVMHNLSDLGIKPSDIEFRLVDLTEYPQVVKAIAGGDVIFHLATRVGNLAYLHSSHTAELAALQTNLLIDTNVLRASLEVGVKKLVYASSCAVYPLDKQYSPGAIFSEDSLELPQKKPCAINPDGGYGWAKLMAEIELMWMKNIDIGIARIFNIYGENEPLGEKAHVITDFMCEAILHPHQQFIVRGNGKQTRDFLYVSDCVEALMKLEQKAASPPLTVNIGSGEAVSIGMIAEKIVALSKKARDIRYDLDNQLGPLSRTADIARARTCLGWQPEVSLEDGLKRTYIWLEKRMSQDREIKSSRGLA